ncbi:hypothetical protein JCM10213v2_001655 [Rhodosporidiobolus nylandii]
MHLAALLALALPALVSATYFTAPQQSTVWDTAVGQTITWHFQAGGASNGDIVLQAVGLGSNPKSGQSVTVASDVDLTSESLTFPSGVALRSATQNYYLLMVNSRDPSDVYTQIGPFSIQSFAASSSAGTSSSAAPISSSSSVDGGAVGNGSGGQSSDAGTNPPVSTSATPSPTSTVLSTITVSRGASSTSSSPAAASSSPSSSSDSASPSNSRSSFSTSTQEPITSTLLSTASGVVITSVLSSSANPNITSSPATVTLPASRSAASVISSTPSAGASGTSDATTVVANWWQIGGLRPYFLVVCRPVIDTSTVGSHFGSIMFTHEICTGDRSEINDSVESMPSGHSTAAWAGLLFLSLHLNGKLKLFSDYRPQATRRLPHQCPLTIDEYHNWYDCVVGGLIGSCSALAAYRLSYASIFDFRFNHLPLPRTPPMSGHHTTAYVAPRFPYDLATVQVASGAGGISPFAGQWRGPAFEGVHGAPGDAMHTSAG